MAEYKVFKVVNALPTTLVADSVYFVKVGNFIEIHVTNGVGEIVSYPLKGMFADSDVVSPAELEERFLIPSVGFDENYFLSGDATTENGDPIQGITLSSAFLALINGKASLTQVQNEIEDQFDIPTGLLNGDQFEAIDSTHEGNAVKRISIKNSILGSGPIANNTLSGNISGNSASPIGLTVNQVKTLLGLASLAEKSTIINTDISETIAVNKGGTGLTTVGGALQVLRTNAAGTGLEYTNPSNIYVMSTAAATTSYNMILGSTVSSSSTTRSDISGWSAALNDNKTYKLEINAKFTTAAATTGASMGLIVTGGSIINVAGFARAGIVSTAAASELVIPITVINNSASSTGSFITTTGITASTSHHINFFVTFTHSGTGTLKVQWGSEVDGSSATLQLGSIFMLTQLN